MIKGTKPYRGRASTAKSSETSTTNEASAPEATHREIPAEAAKDADLEATHTSEKATPNPRREWFRSLIPTLGTGLVEILRASNHLKHELENGKKREE